MKISNEAIRYTEWTKVREWIENNWPPNAEMNPDDLDEMAIGIAGEIDKEIHSLIQQKVDSFIESLGPIKRSDLIEWAYNKNEIVEDKIREIFGVEE